MEEQLFTTATQDEWIEFDGVAYPAAKLRPRVTLNNEGHIGLGKRSIEILERPEAVRFFFDPRNGGRIGILPSKRDELRAFPVKYKKSSGYIYANRFCSRFGIKFEYTIEFVDVQKDGSGMLVLELTKARRLSESVFKMGQRLIAREKANLK